MRQHSTDPFFEQSLSRSTGLVDVRKLIEKNSDRNTKLLKECCQPCMNLISETFSRLKLKDEQFKVYEPSAHKEINKLCTDVGLDEPLKSNDTIAEFSQRAELAQYLNHCARERTYFVSLKKCGSRDCIICKPPRLNDEDFRRLHHLPDPILTTDDHYKEFSDVFGTETTQGAMPSLKTSKDRGHKTPFNPVKIHASNTGLIIDCNKCCKPQLVYTAKRLTDAEKKSFNRVTNDMTYTCGATFVEFKDPSNPSNRRYDIPDNCFVRANNNCSKPVEPLHYTCNQGCQRA